MNTLKRLLAVGITAGWSLSAFAGSTISSNSSDKWAWSSGAGWINCRTDSTNGVAIGQYYCSGYMYSSSAGWIHLGNGAPSNGLSYATNSTTDYGVNVDSYGHLRGYAWCPSAGWINFEWTNNLDHPNAPKVDFKTGICSGYAWGGSLGWISLSNLMAKLKTDAISAGADTASNGIPDAWEITVAGATNLLAADGDYDHDGTSDYNEYLADTHPTNQNDCLEATSFSFSGSDLQIIWSSKTSRQYRIEMKTNLLDPVWVDSGLGTFTPDGTTTLKTITMYTQGFFRVKAKLPLPLN